MTISINEAALAANQAYKSARQSKTFIDPDLKDLGYEYLGSSDDYGLSNSGYFAAIFKKGDTILIAHRGTNFNDFSSPDDVISDIQIGFNNIPNLLKYANKLTTIVQNQYGNNHNILCVGHSLGDYLCKLSGIAHGIDSIGFDSPGISGIAKSLYTPKQIASVKITSYAASPNAFNTVGEHLFPPTQIVFSTHSELFGKAGYLSHPRF